MGKIYPTSHIFFGLLLLEIFSSRNNIELSNSNRLSVAIVSVLPDIDYAIDLIYGTNYHSFQSIPIFVALMAFLVLYFSTETYRKPAFLVSMGLLSQFFGDLLVGSYTYRILDSRHLISVSFTMFMASFEFIMPIIFLVFILLKRIAVSGDIEITE